jgi:hypothetical protein
VVRAVPANSVVVGVPGQVVSRSRPRLPTAVPDLDATSVPDLFGASLRSLLRRVDRLEQSLPDDEAVTSRRPGRDRLHRRLPRSGPPRVGHLRDLRPEAPAPQRHLAGARVGKRRRASVDDDQLPVVVGNDRHQIGVLRVTELARRTIVTSCTNLLGPQHARRRLQARRAQSDRSRTAGRRSADRRLRSSPSTSECLVAFRVGDGHRQTLAVRVSARVNCTNSIVLV